jgi:hypothetical protein
VVHSAANSDSVLATSPTTVAVFARDRMASAQRLLVVEYMQHCIEGRKLYSPVVQTVSRLLPPNRRSTCQVQYESPVLM